MSNVIEALLKRFPIKKSPGLQNSLLNFIIFLKNFPILFKVLHKILEGKLPNSCYGTHVTLIQKQIRMQQQKENC
jgi:hypothetical protein